MPPTLAEITGQQDVIDHVLGLMLLDRKETFLVSGPGGSGVSWALNEMGKEWERRGGIALKATGIATTPSRPLLPWLTMTSLGRGTLVRWELLKGSATELSKAIPAVGDAAGYLVSEVLNYKRKKLARQAQVLGEKEQDLMFVIETAAKGKRLLLLLDQICDWDEESWGLLTLIVSPLLHELYPSLKNVFIVLGSSEEVLARCRNLAEKLPCDEQVVKRLQRENLSIALKTFAFPDVGDQEMNFLYDVTGGRLDLLHDFASLARDAGIVNISAETGYGRLIERRLRSIKGDISALESLLSAASFLGSSFSPEEASCLTGFPIDELQPILRRAEEEKLLGTIGSYVSFPSVAMRHYFLSSRVGNPSKYHGKFAECLRKMRPGDYGERCKHLLLAGQIDAALVCHCLAALDALRRKRVLTNVEGLPQADGWQEYAAYLALMKSAYAAYDRDSLSEGTTILESIESFLPDALIAERDYLEAQFRMKSHRVADVQKAVSVLQRWQALKDSEPEIWSRVAQTLMVALSETQQYHEAFQLEEALTKHYGSRRTLDPWAIYGLNCLRRQSECLHHLVPSRNRLHSALAYFGPTAAGGVPRHPLQYYYTLTNLVANLIANGSFAEATAYGAELQRLIQNHPSLDWPGLEIPANNTILAAYLAGVLPLTKAIALMREIDDGRTEIGDRLLIQNNLAVLLIHHGELAVAEHILLNASEQMGGKADSDAYHRYFVTNNLAGLMALKGDAQRANQLLEDVGSDLNCLYPAIKETLLRRHAMIPEAIKLASELGVHKFDQFLLERHVPQIGPQWRFYGRGFLLTDIQFWISD